MKRVPRGEKVQTEGPVYKRTRVNVSLYLLWWLMSADWIYSVYEYRIHKTPLSRFTFRTWKTAAYTNHCNLRSLVWFYRWSWLSSLHIQYQFPVRLAKHNFDPSPTIKPYLAAYIMDSGGTIYARNKCHYSCGHYARS